MAFWNEQETNFNTTFYSNSPKTINDAFSEKNMIELATEGKSLWSGIAKVSKVGVDRHDYGPHYDYTKYITTVQLELEGKNGPETYTLKYNNDVTKKFTEGANISFVGTKDGDKLNLIMIGEPADLETIQSKVKDATENGLTIIKMNKIKEQLQTAGAFLVKPLKKAFIELKGSWEAAKKERQIKEQNRINEEKAEREAKNNRPTGYYTQPEEQTKNNDLLK